MQFAAMTTGGKYGGNWPIRWLHNVTRYTNAFVWVGVHVCVCPLQVSAAWSRYLAVDAQPNLIARCCQLEFKGALRSRPG